MSRERREPSVGPRLRAPAPPALRGGDLGFTALVAALLGGIEGAARLSSGESDDGTAAVALVLAAVLVRRRHRRRPLPGLSALGGLVRTVARRVVAPFAIRIEVDLRGTPPIPGGFPAPLGLAAGAGVALAVAAALVPGLRLEALRDPVRAVSAAAWCALLGATWAALFAGSLLALVAAVAGFHDELVLSRPPDARGPGRLRPWLPLLVPAGALAAWLALPGAGAAVAAAATAASLLPALLPGFPDQPLLWRPASGGPVRSCGWRWILPSMGVAAAAPAVALALLAAAPGTLPGTASFAGLFGWCAAAAAAGQGLHFLRFCLEARLRDPASPGPAPLWILGPPLGPRARGDAERMLRSAGFRARFAPSPRRRDEAAVLLPGGAASAADPEVRARLARRAEIHARRLLSSGLETAFRRVARRAFRSGTGFWIAPHLWFFPGMSRDTEDRDPSGGEDGGTWMHGVVGPSWRTLLPLAARRHLHRVLRGLDVDLLFVEDGVGWRRFRRVLGVLFERHDVHGGARRAAEVDFVGIPGVRVLLHEIDGDGTRPWTSPYREPKFEALGRARILLVFRDTGEAHERAGAPRDRTDAPVFA